MAWGYRSLLSRTRSTKVCEKEDESCVVNVCRAGGRTTSYTIQTAEHQGLCVCNRLLSHFEPAVFQCSMGSGTVTEREKQPVYGYLSSHVSSLPPFLPYLGLSTRISLSKAMACWLHACSDGKVYAREVTFAIVRTELLPLNGVQP